MSIKGEASGESARADLRETGGETVLVLTYKGQADRSADELVSAMRKGSRVEYMSPDALPIEPPAGVREVLLSSGNDIVFLSKEHQQNWSTVSFKRLVHPQDGDMARFSNDQDSMKSADFKVAGE